jgi:hypothetical protein
MDERLERALEFSNFRYTAYLEKRRLQEKLKSDLMFYHNGGRFFLDRNFIVFLNLITPEEGTGTITVLDDKLTPVLVEDIKKLQKEAIDQYSSVTKKYHIEFESLKKKRSVKSLIDL